MIPIDEKSGARERTSLTQATRAAQTTSKNAGHHNRACDDESLRFSGKKPVNVDERRSRLVAHEGAQMRARESANVRVCKFSRTPTRTRSIGLTSARVSPKLCAPLLS
jgi:hypothetical protein